MPDLPHGLFPTSGTGVGCGHVTAGWSRDRDARIIHAAYEAGARHFDLAPSYGLGTAEDVLGHALKGRRDRVTIASKVGLPRAERSRPLLVARALAAPFRRARPGIGRAPGTAAVPD